MRGRSPITREKLVFLRNLARVHVFSPRLIVTANRLTWQARERGAFQKRSEFAPFLALLLRRPPRCIVEIGRGGGGGLWALCQVATVDATIVSVDLPEGPYGGQPDDPAKLASHASYARPGQELLLVQGDSHATENVRRVRQATAAVVDLLFIDGDHTFEGVKSDYEAYSPLVREGGLIVFHDILPHDAYPEVGVHRLWSSLEGKKVELTSPSELAETFGWGGRGQWGGIGILEAPVSP